MSQPALFLPPAARYRYLLSDLRTGQILSDARGLTVTSFSRRLCNATECTARMSVASATLRAADNPINSTEPRRTALWIIRNERLVWGGIIWTRRYYSDTADLDLGVTSFESYFARRRIRLTMTFAQVDQHRILWHLAYHASAQAYGGIGLELPVPADSGTVRDRNYFWHERATYLERMQQLADVLGGPDFTFEPTWRADGSPAATLLVGSPLGVPAAVRLLEYPGDIRNYSWPDDGGDSANFWTAIGDPAPGDDDGPPLMRDASMPAEWAAGYPLLEDVSDHQGVTDVGTLDGYARSNVAAAAGNRVVPEVTVRMPPAYELPGLGDTLRLRVSDPYRFPADPTTGAPGIAAEVRVTGWTVNISEGEGETLAVSLSDVNQQPRAVADADL